MSLDYRSPQTTEHRLARVMQELENVETFSRAATFGKLMVGIPLCLIGPLFVAFILKLVESNWNGNWLPSFTNTSVFAMIAIIPLLMWLERRTRGEFLSDALQGEDSRFDSYGEYELRSTKFLWAFYTEVALLGPRLLWNAIDTLRGREEIDERLRLIAAQIVLELLDHEHAITTKQLIQPGQPTNDVIHVLNYLRQCDWIDFSRQRDKVWLSSPVRQKLAKL
ncbi:MAG TPA: hypothetical protein VKK61_10360 [Tepidisphaeraceae bacterium]|nr:hypothetical protein [Tepidisphaeraceae bacterium]